MSPKQTNLSVEGIGKWFGGVLAVDNFSLEADGTAVVGLIGPNGAGKTTVFNLITGLVEADSGRTLLSGRDITNMPAQRVAHLGVQRTFQNLRLFNGLTVRDNVAVGALGRKRHALARAREKAERLLDDVGFKGSHDARPADLPYAFQRRVEIARALAADPDVILLDEPAAGMHVNERDELAVLIRQLHERGILIILVEHDMALVSRVCDQIVAMDFGKVIASGTPDEVRSDTAVIEAYLGVAE
jgi:branched-chain amino acid transport system ATP-binding protein